jgi:hypothetical protein
MELATAVTVWITFGAWLFLPTVNAPERFSRIALWLCGTELLAAAIWSYGSAGCDERPCAPVAEAARSAAALDIPFLTGVAIVLGCAYAARRGGRVRDGRHAGGRSSGSRSISGQPALRTATEDDDVVGRHSRCGRPAP